MDYNQAVRVIDGVISGSYDSKNCKLECSANKVSKIVFERYVNAEIGSMKLFQYTEGKVGNNHPYKYERMVTTKEFVAIDDCLMVILEKSKDKNILDDLLKFDPMEDLEDAE